MRILIARCEINYRGRATTHLDEAVRVLMVKDDGSVLVHADMGSKPLNYMVGPCTVMETPQGWTVTNKKATETLAITIAEVLHDHTLALGDEPGLIKPGSEKELQFLVAGQVETVLGDGYALVSREYRTAVGPVDILARDSDGRHVAVEIKRNGGPAGVRQLIGYLDDLNADPSLAPVSGVYAAQKITDRARALAEAKGIRCVLLDYETLKGTRREATTGRMASTG